MPDQAKDIFVEISIRAIKDGAQWQGTTVEFPNTTEDGYTAMEQALGAALMGFDDLKKALEGGSVIAGSKR